MKATLTVLLILAAALTTTAVAGSGLPTYRKGTLVVRIQSKKDLKGVPCVIDLSRPSPMRTFTYTNVAVIDSIEPGEYSAKVYRGSSVGVARATVLPGDTVEMNVVVNDPMPGTCLLEGHVLEPSTREPVENVTVTSSAGRQTTTNAEGYFAMYNHPAGGYFLSVQKDTIAGTLYYAFMPDGRLSETFLLGTKTTLPVTDGLMAYYPLNGNASDMGPYALHGTLQGAVSGADRHGRPNGSLTFDGTSYVDIPHADWQQSFPMSVSFWLKASPANAHTVFILGKYLHPLGEGWTVFLENGLLCAGDFRAHFANWSRVNTVSSITDNKWHHVVITMGDGQLTLYVDGARVPARPYGPNISATVSTEPMRLGKINSTIWNPNPGLKGAMDDVALYDRVLTEEEIRRMMEVK